jgi:hypothetical protein
VEIFDYIKFEASTENYALKSFHVISHIKVELKTMFWRPILSPSARSIDDGETAVFQNIGF